MTAQALSPKQTVTLCRLVATMALSRLQLLARLAERQDEPLKRLLSELVEEMESHVLEINRFDAQGDAPQAVPPETGVEIVRRLLPSLWKPTGDRSLDRESGIYLAECLGEDVADLYRMLALQAVDPESRAFYTRSKDSIETRLAYLRTVVL